MRTNIELDDALLNKAMKVFGLKTKRATVEEALRRAIRTEEQLRAIRDMRGIGWEGDLEATRRDDVEY